MFLFNSGECICQTLNPTSHDQVGGGGGGLGIWFEEGSWAIPGASYIWTLIEHIYIYILFFYSFIYLFICRECMCLPIYIYVYTHLYFSYGCLCVCLCVCARDFVVGCSSWFCLPRTMEYGIWIQEQSRCVLQYLSPGVCFFGCSLMCTRGAHLSAWVWFTLMFCV